MNFDLVLIGGGGHCKSCIDVIEQSGQFTIVGILDKPEQVGQKVLDYHIIGTDNMIEQWQKKGCFFLISIGQIGGSQVRQRLFNQLLTCNANLATIISPRAYVSQHAQVQEGTIVMHDVLINANAKIGKNCIINSKALIEHDVIVEDHCHISTAAVLNGGVHVNEGTFFGSNSVSIENATTTNEAFIKAGSLFKG